MVKVLAHRKQAAEESANNDDCLHVPNSSLVRLFNVPTLNLEANAYYELTHFYSDQQLQTRQPSEIALFCREVSFDTT